MWFYWTINIFYPILFIKKRYRGLTETGNVEKEGGGGPVCTSGIDKEIGRTVIDLTGLLLRLGIPV